MPKHPPRGQRRSSTGGSVPFVGTALFVLAAGLASVSGCQPGNGGGAAGSGGRGSGGAANGTGGGTGSGGGNGSGGNRGSGGASSSGGTTGSGGSGDGSGGASHSGGASGTGGTPGTGGGGTGGATGSGGMTGTGAAGGVPASSGGAPGTGGVQGAGGGAGAGATGSGGAAGAMVTPFFTADFETDTPNKQPAGWDNFISYNFNTTNPQGDGTGALVDTMHVHGGKNAVHFHSTGNPVMLERALPAGTNRLYVRAYFYLTTQLGNGPQGDNHETLLGLTGDPTSVNKQVRFGVIKGAIGTNETPSDNIAPKMAMWYMPPIITANAWHCIEVAFLGDQTPNALSAWSDTVLVHSITADNQWQNGSLTNWLTGKFVDAMFGWQSFGSQANDVWMDDLDMSTGPLDCPPP